MTYRVNTEDKTKTSSDADPEIKALRQKLQSMQDAYYNHVEHIFYTSRTHMQLTQVIKELKENSYLMKRHDELGMIYILLYHHRSPSYSSFEYSLSSIKKELLCE